MALNLLLVLPDASGVWFFLRGCAEKDKPEQKLSSELMLLCNCILEQGA